MTSSGQERPSDDRPVSARPRPVVRLAGVLLALVGVGNAVLGLVAWATDRIDLPTSTSVALVVLGSVTAALGALVWTGRRWATVLALVVFGGLFGIQALGATGGAPAPAVITLAVVLVPLVLAARAQRADD